MLTDGAAGKHCKSLIIGLVYWACLLLVIVKGIEIERPSSPRLFVVDSSPPQSQNIKNTCLFDHLTCC